jgi:ABC-type multidrug transport system, ATPase and permease components
MLQDSFIFSGTLMDNIRYGRLDATDAEVMEAAKRVRADELIRKMPQGYQTEIRERGGNLSQGEKQLVAFARTLLSDPAILILDEATSSIDTQTEKLLQEGIQEMLRGPYKYHRRAPPEYHQKLRPYSVYQQQRNC